MLNRAADATTLADRRVIFICLDDMWLRDGSLLSVVVFWIFVPAEITNADFTVSDDVLERAGYEICRYLGTNCADSTS